jgi:outer membrane lipoprotein-sorting protein
MPSARLLRRTFVLLGAAAPVWVSGVARADATDDALAAVTAARKDVKTLVARFTQIRKVGLLAEEVKSTGELIAVMPDQLRWELFAPDAITFWVSKKGIVYKDAKGKVGKAPKDALGTLLPDLITFVGGDIGSLRSRYDITASQKSDGAVEIGAVPKNDEAKKVFKRLDVVTNAQRWGIAKIVITEPNGDGSTITFEANKKNEKVDAAKMKPPA